MNVLPYDCTNPKSIENYAKNLIGLSFEDVLKSAVDDEDLFSELKIIYNNPRGKGSLGNLIEKYFFFYEPNSISEPDFKEAGTELKVTPYEITKKNKIKAGERLVITMIPFDREVTDDFYESHLIEKIQLILFIFYFRDRTVERLEYLINYVSLFSILSEKCKTDLEIIIEDYKKIIHKIQAGKAHELSESDTLYLGACTKGSTALKSYRNQFYGDIPAKSRAFSLKQSYMTYLLNHYILNNIETYESIVDSTHIDPEDFENSITRIINENIGKSETDLYRIYDVPRSKHSNNLLVLRMLGVKSENAEEFDKANIEIKTIRVQKNGRPKESMSFPTFNIMEFTQETWENSTIFEKFDETRFLFVIFKEDESGEYLLQGSKFWNMPVSDLNSYGKKEWELYQKKFLEGINFEIRESGASYRVINDLPKSSYTKIFHIRPHASQSAYKINGVRYGKGSDSDMDLLPNGDKMTKQCFWLNNDYIKEQIKDLIN